MGGIHLGLQRKGKIVLQNFASFFAFCSLSKNAKIKRKFREKINRKFRENNGNYAKKFAKNT